MPLWSCPVRHRVCSHTRLLSPQAWHTVLACLRSEQDTVIVTKIVILLLGLKDCLLFSGAAMAANLQKSGVSFFFDLSVLGLRAHTLGVHSVVFLIIQLL